VDSYPYLAKEGQRYINLNRGLLSVQQPPKKGKGSRGSLKLLCNRLQQGEITITLQDETKSDATTKHASLTKKYIKDKKISPIRD